MRTIRDSSRQKQRVGQNNVRGRKMLKRKEMFMENQISAILDLLGNKVVHFIGFLGSWISQKNTWLGPGVKLSPKCFSVDIKARQPKTLNCS